MQNMYKKKILTFKAVIFQTLLFPHHFDVQNVNNRFIHKGSYFT